MRTPRHSIAALLISLALILLTACTSPFASIQPTQDATAIHIAYGDTWEHIKSQGKMLVGISTDTRPFAFYTNQFQVDGFDVAILRDIGQNLGVNVEFHDFSSDGLAFALQSGQIDAAIMRVTTSTLSIVNLSNTFYFGDDAVLVADGSPFNAINTVNDLVNLRVGVTQGSIYQYWLARMLPAENVAAFTQSKDAIAELKTQTVDVALFDLATAQALVNQGGVHLIGQGLYRQQLAVATGSGSQNLLSRFNNALDKMQREGRINQLAHQYLAIDPTAILPLPAATIKPDTPGALITASVPVTGCITGLAVLQNVTLDDQFLSNVPVVQPGENLTKTWRVRNRGTCPWYLPYRLVYLYGNAPDARMNGLPVLIDREIKPGQSGFLSLHLTAPEKPGIYGGVWQMIDGRSMPFGERMHVVISVTATTP